MFGISYEDGLSYNYAWYAFPWQFCSTPMYIGLLAGLSKGKLHDHFCAYLATFALFAGTAVMQKSFVGDYLFHQSLFLR